MKAIWLVSRELEGWAAAGGVKDVVGDQAQAFGQLGWQATVVLPLYGFLKERVFHRGQRIQTGHLSSPHWRGTAFEVWQVIEKGFRIHLIRIPSFENKKGIYTYTLEEEEQNPHHVRGEGYQDSLTMNLEFQWAVADYWHQSGQAPSIVLGHDGHVGFLPAMARTGQQYHEFFAPTRFALLIHNAGSLYRQEMPKNEASRQLIQLAPEVLRKAVLENHYDPVVCAAHYAQLATVSVHYAQELLTGRNDHWSGAFGRWLREHHIPLQGITNGLSLDDKDPRYPQQSLLPAAFDPLQGQWDGKELCRHTLRDQLSLSALAKHGRLVHWNEALYIFQGRLTTQKGIDALLELLEHALRDDVSASFLIMAQGERRYEERLIKLAREQLELGRLLFINHYDDALARLLFASGDFFLMPSEYEPCGLTDLKAQMMGTLPIVHGVGGLWKVIDGETGFVYVKNQHRGLWGAFLRSLELYRNQPRQLDSMRRKAFQNVIENYRWTKILQDFYIPWLTQEAHFSILSHEAPT